MTTRYTITVPTRDNHGTPIDSVRSTRTLLSRIGFTGWTEVNGEGYWHSNETGRYFIESVVTFNIDYSTVLPRQHELQYLRLKQVAAELAKRYEQEGVYVTRQAIEAEVVEPARKSEFAVNLV